MTLISKILIFVYYKMISIKSINEKDIDLCYELDSNTISLWSKKQWICLLYTSDAADE